MIKSTYILGLLVLAIEVHGQTIMSYNVENLFHPSDDVTKVDDEFTEEGKKHWNRYRYHQKLHQMAVVIAAVGEKKRPDIIGLNEVENDSCLIDLCKKMPHYPYRWVHYDSPDERGIDVAMLYDSTTMKVINSVPLAVELDGHDYTRDILYCTMRYKNRDTLHIFVCHLPSQLGGSSATEWKREKAKQVLRQNISFILRQNEQAKIVVMGDFNSAPKEDIKDMYNMMLTMAKKGLGSHKYQGQWTCLDQFYVSESVKIGSEVVIYDAPFLLEEDAKYSSTQPKRTYKGYSYQKDGYSDHLPILLQIKL